MRGESFNLKNDKGRSVANQLFVLTSEGGRGFRSYETDICHYSKDGVLRLNVSYLKKDLSGGSNTTMKYLYMFLRNHCGFVGLGGIKDLRSLVLNDPKVLVVGEDYFKSL